MNRNNIKRNQWTKLAFALLFVAALTSSVAGQEVGASAESGGESKLFYVPEGKDAKFYKELEPQLVREFVDVFDKAKSNEERNQLESQLGEAFFSIYQYTKDGDDAAKRVSSGALLEAISEFTISNSADRLRELRKDPAIAQNAKASIRIDAALIRFATFEAVENDDKDALKAIVEEFFAKSDNDVMPHVGEYIYWKAKDYDAELAGAFAARVVEKFKDGNEAQQEIARRFVGNARFDNLVGNEMKVEGLFVDGTEIDWKSYRGKVVLVDFWATWCGWCVAEFPEIQKLREKYRDKGFEVIGYSVDYDEDFDKLEKFVKEGKIPWKTLSQTLSVAAKKKGGKEYVALGEYYGIAALPTMILVGKDGKVLDTNARGDRLVELLKEQFPDVK